MLVAFLLLSLPSAVMASGASAVGGGIVDGPLGLTSQLGFGATSGDRLGAAQRLYFDDPSILEFPKGVIYRVQFGIDIYLGKTDRTGCYHEDPQGGSTGDGNRWIAST